MAGVPGSADIVNVDVPRAIAAGSSHQRGGRSQDKNCPAPEGQVHEKSQPENDTQQAHALYSFQKSFQIECRANPDVVRVALDEFGSRATAFVAKHDEKLPLGIEFG